MSCQIPLPLPKWRQDTGRKFISQTTVAIKSKVSHCPQFFSLSPLLRINLLGAGAVAIFCELGVSGIQPAQANLPNQQVMRLEQSQAELPTDLDQSRNQKAVASSPQLPAAPSVVILPNSTPVSFGQSVEVGTKGGIESNIEKLIPPPVLAASRSNSNLGWERSPSASQSDCTTNKTCNHTVLSSTSVVHPNRSTPALAQLPSLPPTPAPVGVNNSSNPMGGQIPYFPQPQPYVPMPAMVMPMGMNGYSPTGGQYPYLPQTVLLVPVPATAMPMGMNGYSPTGGQYPYLPPTSAPLPVPVAPNSVGFSNYNPTAGQAPYWQQTPVPQNPNPAGFSNYNPNAGQAPYWQQTPVPQNPNPAGFSNYNPNAGQSAYWQQTPAPLPAPLTPNPAGFSNYNPNAGQSAYWQQTPVPQNPNSVGFNNYNPNAGQAPYWQQTPVPQNPNPAGFSNYNPSAGQAPYWQQTPVPQNPNPIGSDSYYPPGGQSPVFQQTPTQQPNAPNPNLTPQNTTPTRRLGEAPPAQQSTLTRNTALTEPSLQLQGVYVNIGDQSSARARLSGLYPLNPQLQFGATLDLITGEDVFADSRGEGLNINELYLAAAPFRDLPNLRFVFGQLDLTSYFDRNSFAKDGTRDFFSSIFQTNSALSTTGISSRPGALVNWTLTDNIEAKAAVFSSARHMGDFSLDGFAGEIGIRYGNAIIRGTYASDRDAGSRDGFREIFQIARGNQFGLLPSDREESYGVNAEVFIPQLNMGLFGRYGKYKNNAVALEGDTYSIGLNVLDLFTQNDRLGLAYGRSLSNDRLRRENGDKVPDVLELFYDFKFFPNVRLGFTLQERNGFSETIGGFRIKTEFDVTPRGGLTR